MTTILRARALVKAYGGNPALRDCQVLCGIHDSNASLLRYLEADANEQPRTVLSTGTWAIAAAFGARLDRLDETADMLANVNALGQPVACMRFMGGREFSVLAGGSPQLCDVADIARLVEQGTLSLDQDVGTYLGFQVAIPLSQPTRSRCACCLAIPRRCATMPATAGARAPLYATRCSRRAPCGLRAPRPARISRTAI